MELSKNILENFEKSFVQISYFDMWYKFSRFLNKKVELLSYKNKNKDFIFYVDKDGLENHISVYRAYDKQDDSKGIVIEMLIWESKNKEIIFFSEDKIFSIIENKWGKMLDSTIITDYSKINNLLNLINTDLEFLSKKTTKIRNKLRYRGVLNKTISEKVIENFKTNFVNLKLQTS